MVSQCYHQIEIPSEPFTDPYGVLLDVGQVVAYNYCGGVRLGVITKIDCKWKPARQGVGEKQWWHINSKVHINEKSGKSSIVKNLDGIVVIN